MKEITRINHYGLRVNDLDTSRSFYEKLGFEFIVGPVGPEPVAIMCHPSGITINLVLNATEPPAKNILMDIPEKFAGYTHIALEVDNLRVVEQTLQDLTIVITEGPVKVPDGAEFVFIRDPDGNVIEFHQPA